MPFKHTVLERLMHYYYFIADSWSGDEAAAVTSSQIADALHMDDTLVRKDLAAIGVRGQPRVGFKAAEVLAAIRGVLGFDKAYNGVIIGVGRLGSAIASYGGFERFGLRICAMFDNDPIKLGLMQGGLVVLAMDKLPLVVADKPVRLAILTVPDENAQEAADQAVAAGIEAIWNFASPNLVLPDHVFVRNEHISVGLAELTYSLTHRDSRA